MANDRDSKNIFSKAMGRKLFDTLSADIYLRCRMDLTRNAVGIEAPNIVHLKHPDVNASDEFNNLCNPTTRVRIPKDGSSWSATDHVFGEATAVGMSGTRLE